jgi:hypothetical protein
MPDKSPEIKIFIRLVEGDRDEFKVNLHEPVRSLIQRALAHFHLQPTAGVVYKFFFQGRLLDENKTLGEEGVQDGSELLFGTEQQVGDAVWTSRQRRNS